VVGLGFEKEIFSRTTTTQDFTLLKVRERETTASFDTKNTPVVSFLMEKMVMIVVNTKSET
jgi:hypothetical protein